MSSKPELLLAFCNNKTADYAVKHWHYSKSMAHNGVVPIGIWEDKKFIGVIVFGRGPCKSLGGQFKLRSTEVCELTRVALNRHRTPVSRLLKIAFSLLKKSSPKIRLVVSYADSEHNHIGGIYQATNWIYLGPSYATRFILHGKQVHPRSVCSKYPTSKLSWLREHVDKNASRIDSKAKYKYLYPLDAAMRAAILPLHKPYPKRATSIDNDAVAFQAAEGGANPTVALHTISSGDAGEAI